MALDSSVPFGVSPAWFISKFGEGFTLAQMVSQLPTIHSLGFDFWQPEVFRKEDLQSWTPGDISKLNRVQADLGVSPSQGVAHFLMNDFTSPDSLRAKVGLPYFRDLLAKAKTIDGFKRICFPLPPFIFSPGLDYLTSYEMLRSYVAQLLEMTQAMGFELTVEIMPGSLVQGTEGFLRLWNELGSPAHFGFCLDSGHVWGGREHLVSLPQRLGMQLRSTHLGDHDGSELVKKAPGRGTVPFEALLREVYQSGYDGSLDIEFVCEPSAVENQYKQGLEYLKGILKSL